MSLSCFVNVHKPSPNTVLPSSRSTTLLPNWKRRLIGTKTFTTRSRNISVVFHLFKNDEQILYYFFSKKHKNISFYIILYLFCLFGNFFLLLFSKQETFSLKKIMTSRKRKHVVYTLYYCL